MRRLFFAIAFSVTVQFNIRFYSEMMMNGKSRGYRLTLLVAFGTAAACTEARVAESTAPSDLELRLGRQVKVDTSQANLVWDDSVNVAAVGSPDLWAPAGIRGDGRDKYGAPSSVSEYQGRFCGFVGYLGVDGGSALNAEPDFGYTSSMAGACGSPARTYRFYYDGATTPTFTFGPHHTVLNLGSLAVGQDLVEEIWFGVQQSDCQRLDYNDAIAPSSSALITRLPDVATANGSARRWRVRSRGTHRAACLIPKKGGTLVSSGVTHYLPFSFTITEILPIAPWYP